MTRPNTIKGLMDYIINCDRMYDFTGDIKYKQEALEALELLNILLKGVKVWVN